MNLFRLYTSLDLPYNDGRVYNAISIPKYPNFRVGIDCEGYAVLLLSVSKRIDHVSLKNFRLKYLQLELNVECLVCEDGNNVLQTFTIVTFRCRDAKLIEYFMIVSETLVKTIGPHPTQQQVTDSLKRLTEVFKTLSQSPTNTVNGLWAELFIIENSRDPSVLLDYWHNTPKEIFDFSAGTERLEVKSSSNFERKHIFSAEQLNPPADTQVLIASVFLKQHNSGKSLQDLARSICIKIDCGLVMLDKLNTTILRTLGDSIEHSLAIKFDYDIAKQSLRFYRHQDIDKIEAIHIPNNVSDVKYRSDLTNVKSTEPNKLVNRKMMFEML